MNKNIVLTTERLGWAARLFAAALMWMTGGAFRAEAQAAPAAVEWPNIYLTQVAAGFTRPVHINHAGDGSDRLFVVEQPGIIRIIQNGTTLATPFLNISSSGENRVKYADGEEGLLSVAFPPGFPDSGKDHFYVYYTSRVSGTNGDNVVARYSLTSPNVADPASEKIVLVLEHPGESNHNGGQLAFGPNDGYLYIGPGDGGGGGDPNNNAQNLNSELGKILRIDVETGSPVTYTVPATNPFVGQEGLDEIWAWGLRNPWRFSFDRNNADLYIGDVGQGSWEEIDFQSGSSNGGENYGWDCREGMHAYSSPGHDCSGLTDDVDPVEEYSHTLGCSVTGGFVYRGTIYERMQGIYFYGDYCSGRIWGLQRDGLNWVSTELENTPYLISAFGEDEAGELYLANRNAGEIYRLSADDQFYYLPIAVKN